MARPKPPEELKMHSVRLSDRQWARFQTFGGQAWLRKKLDQHNATKTMSEKQRLARNWKIKILWASGRFKRSTLALQFGLSPTQISVIVNDYVAPQRKAA